MAVALQHLTTLVATTAFGHCLSCGYAVVAVVVAVAIVMATMTVLTTTANKTNNIHS